MVAIIVKKQLLFVCNNVGNCVMSFNSKWQPVGNLKAKNIGGILICANIFWFIKTYSPCANLKNWNLGFISNIKITVEVPFKGRIFLGLFQNRNT